MMMMYKITQCSAFVGRTNRFKRVFTSVDMFIIFMDFRCIDECAQCCIKREYYPSKKFGKIGVLILPEEKKKVETLSKSLNIPVKILPRIATSDTCAAPTNIIAYQMMGKESNGDTCPFLDTESESKSPHGGYPCKIYEQRPLACKAYPLNEINPVILDEKCKFCKECGNTTASGNLESERESLLKIKASVNGNNDQHYIWRFATKIGEQADAELFDFGWIREDDNT